MSGLLRARNTRIQISGLNDFFCTFCSCAVGVRGDNLNSEAPEKSTLYFSAYVSRRALLLHGVLAPCVRHLFASTSDERVSARVPGRFPDIAAAVTSRRHVRLHECTAAPGGTCAAACASRPRREPRDQHTPEGAATNARTHARTHARRFQRQPPPPPPSSLTLRRAAPPPPSLPGSPQDAPALATPPDRTTRPPPRTPPRPAPPPVAAAPKAACLVRSRRRGRCGGDGSGRGRLVGVGAWIEHPYS